MPQAVIQLHPLTRRNAILICQVHIEDHPAGLFIAIPIQISDRNVHGRGACRKIHFRLERNSSGRTCVLEHGNLVGPIVGDHQIRRQPVRSAGWSKAMLNPSLRLGLALLTMLGTAVAWVEMKKPQNMRSLVKAA